MGALGLVGEGWPFATTALLVSLNRQSGVECGDELVERPLNLRRLLVVARLLQDAVELRV